MPEKDSSILGNTNLALSLLLSGAKNICVPLIPSEVTSTLLIASNSCVVKLDVAPTKTRVNLSLDLSNPSIVTL